MKIKLDKEIDQVNGWALTPELPINVQESMALNALNSMNFMFKKVRNKYKLFCPNCNDYTLYSENDFKKIKKSCVCPKCRIERDGLIDCNKYGDKLITWDFVTFGAYGYEVDCNYKWNKEPNFFIKKVFKNKNGRYWVRGIYTTGYWNGSVKPYFCYHNQNEHRKNEWHITNCIQYRELFAGRTFEYYKQSTKKNVLEKYKNLNLKSNQIKMILDNPVSEAQIYAIKLYDFKRIEDVYRYKKTIDSNKYSIIEAVRDNLAFNTSTIEYLRKNKIQVNDYVDYAQACQKINRKLDKPKDFKLWHDRITQLAQVSKNKQYSKGCKQQWKRLKKNIYQNKEITIKPFEDIEEIVYVSMALHNCMSRMYIDKYANNKTELYHLDINGIPTLAIEVNKGKLIQCRADHNADPDPRLKRIVKRWQASLC